MMMTAPSTISPEIDGAETIRLALIRPCNIPVAVISIATGMTSAAMNAARNLPSITN